MTNELETPALDEREVHKHDSRRETVAKARPRTSWKAVLVAILALGLAGGAGYLAFETQKKLGGATAELKAAQDELGRERDKAGKLAVRAATLEGEVGENKSARATSEKQVFHLRANESATRAELDELRKQRAELEQRLAAWK